MSSQLKVATTLLKKDYNVVALLAAFLTYI
jgi:hypothetical protein